MKIAFVIANAYGMGGTVRTVFTVAGGLAARHDVEIVSLVRHREEPFFTVPDGVRVTSLARVGESARPADRDSGKQARRIIPQPERRRNKSFTTAAVAALRRYLRTTRADAVIGTRPGINLLLASWTPRHVLALGQEHVNLGEHAPEVRAAIARLYPRLDGLTVLTNADCAAYSRLFGRDAPAPTVLPNPLPPGPQPRSTQANPIIAAAGRLSPIKQYPKLLDAFAPVAADHPEWRLRIYGGGRQAEELRAAIARRGLGNQVQLMGRTADLSTELAKASLLAVSSRVEGFGMTLIEGFAAGLPAVSFDCPHGPREIISDGRNGLLVADQDVDALSTALRRMVADDALRRRMSAGALESSSTYALEGVLARWEHFLADRAKRRAVHRNLPRFVPALSRRWRAAI